MRPKSSGLSTTRNTLVFLPVEAVYDGTREALFCFQSTRSSVPVLSSLWMSSDEPSTQRLSRQGPKPRKTRLTTAMRNGVACGGFNSVIVRV
jgi:hypothetical protein